MPPPSLSQQIEADAKPKAQCKLTPYNLQQLKFGPLALSFLQPQPTARQHPTSTTSRRSWGVRREATTWPSTGAESRIPHLKRVFRGFRDGSLISTNATYFTQSKLTCGAPPVQESTQSTVHISDGVNVSISGIEFKFVLNAVISLIEPKRDIALNLNGVRFSSNHAEFKYYETPAIYQYGRGLVPRLGGRI
jgi:hypothetical protein